MRGLSLLLSLTMMCGLIRADKRSMNIVCVGDSVTAGTQLPDPPNDAPPARLCEYLRKQDDIGSVHCVNMGLSGVTTVDLLPATNTSFNAVKSAADPYKDATNGTLVFSIDLGLPDSATRGAVTGAPVLDVQYQTNLQVIIDKLLSLYPNAKVVVHSPTYYTPNTFNSGMFLLQGLERLQSYGPKIKLLVDSYAQTKPGTVFLGDTQAFKYFEENHEKEMLPEEGNAGTFYAHPDKQGSAKLGEFWGQAIHALPIN